MRRILISAVLAAVAAAPGCRLFRRSAKPQVPVRIMQPPPEVKAEPKEVPPAPDLPAQQVELEEQMPLPGEPLPGPPRRRRPRPQQPAPAQPAEEAQAPAVEPPAAPPPVAQLTQVLTPEEQAAYNATVDRNLDRARRTVAALAGRRLSKNQAVYLERIKSFIQQATEARSTDLVRAVNLSERASLLAEDLLRSF